MDENSALKSDTGEKEPSAPYMDGRPNALMTDSQESDGYPNGNDNEDAGDDDDDEEFVEYENLTRPLFDYIQRRVSDFRNLPVQEPGDLAAFKAFWREKFDLMRNELRNSGESDLFLTKPPLEKLEVEIMPYPSEGCPCCTGYVEDDIVIEIKGGITRDAFLEAVGERLYGERAIDRIRSQRPVIRDWDCMESYIDGGPGKALYSSGPEHRIWVYCEGVR